MFRRRHSQGVLSVVCVAGVGAVRPALEAHTVVAVPAGILHQVLLVLRMGRIELREWGCQRLSNECHMSVDEDDSGVHSRKGECVSARETWNSNSERWDPGVASST